MTYTTAEWPHGFYRAGRDIPADDPNFPGRHRIVVTAGLHQVGNNPRPYFSVTAEVVDRTKNRNASTFVVASGGMHEDVARHFPELVPVIPLHLSDDDGAPMHAVGNGRYWLGLTRHKTAEARPEPNGPLVTVDLPYLPYVASHLRVTEDQAAELAERYPADGTADLEAFTAEVDAMRPRWAEEAAAASALIAEHAAGK